MIKYEKNLDAVQVYEKLRAQGETEIGILNFGDYRKPGGTFGEEKIEWGQEELLCKRFEGLYKDMCEHRGFYKRVNTKEDKFFWTYLNDVSIVTCPPPLPKQFADCKERGKKVLESAALHNLRHFIVGWWGCEEGRSPREVLMSFINMDKYGNYPFVIWWPDPDNKLEELAKEFYKFRRGRADGR